MRKYIEKKILPEYYHAVYSGEKTFEIRKDEDDIQVDDVVFLLEYDGKEYTGYVIKARVTYVLRNCPEYGLMDGYCVFGIKPYYKGYYFRGKRRKMNVIENY